ncbi:MAG TPA: hypothetical protein VIG99_22355 [Myxococcaceae bacterium]
MGSPEPIGYVVGGVLLPGDAEQTAAELLPFRQWWLAKGQRWPPHASGLSDKQVRDALLHQAAEVVLQLGGMWLFVAAHRLDMVPSREDLGLFVRMFRATVELAGRVVASLGGGALDVRPASRSLPLGPQLARAAESLGVGIMVDPGEDSEGYVRAMPSDEARDTIAALACEPAGDLSPWPSLRSAHDEVATYWGAHPGLVLADVGCHFIRRQQVQGGSTFEQLIGPLGRGALPAVVVPFSALPPLRALEQAMRDSPPNLVAAGRKLVELEDRAHATGVGPPALREGAARCGQMLWERAVAALATAPIPAGFARALAFEVELQLGARAGADLGTWLALSTGWTGPDALATAVRSSCDPRLAARLWRLGHECAQRRGYVELASTALAEWEALLAPGRPETALSDELEALHLALLVAQDRLPATPEQIAEVTSDLEQRTRQLAALADRAAEGGGGVAPVLFNGTRADEDDLWRAATGGDPSWAPPDLVRGTAYETTARALAFLGHLDEAREMALRARTLSCDSPVERSINAATIALIEIERGRCLGAKAVSEKLLEAALSLCGALVFFNPHEVAVFRAAGDPGGRLALDIAVRALLWAPPEGSSPAEVVQRLRTSDLRQQLSVGEPRSLPTGLLARHVAELLRRYNHPTEAVSGWFALSVELCGSVAAGDAQRSFAAFTERLAKDPGFRGDGAPGSVLNPTFEHR